MIVLPRILSVRLVQSRLALPNPHRQSLQAILLRSRVQYARHSSTQFPSHPPSPPRRRYLRQFLFISGFSIVFTSAGFLLATVPAAANVLALMTAPTSEDAVKKMYRTEAEVVKTIEEHLSNHPIAKEIREKPGWRMLRPHLTIPEDQRKFNLTIGTLLGPNRFPIPPLIFTDDKELVELLYVGTEMCGHVGVVHGGLVATMLDEGLAWCGFGSLPNHIGMTAYLNINYRKPVPAGSYLLLRAETTKYEGRKVWVKGTIEVLGDDKMPTDKLVDAEALYIEPKWAKFMPRIF